MQTFKKTQTLVGQIVENGAVVRYVVYLDLTDKHKIETPEGVWMLAKNGSMTNCIAYEINGKHALRGKAGSSLSELKRFSYADFKKIQQCDSSIKIKMTEL